VNSFWTLILAWRSKVNGLILKHIILCFQTCNVNQRYTIANVIFRLLCMPKVWRWKALNQGLGAYRWHHLGYASGER
jgi:hypothetical protein